MGKSLIALTCSLVLAIAACESQPPSAPQSGPSDELAPVPLAPLPTANASCRYSTTGSAPASTEASIPVGTTRIFLPINASDCDGAWGFITPTDGRLEFGVGAQCTDFNQEEAGAGHMFKVYRCSGIGGQLKIYTNGSQTTLLQTIGIDLIP